MDKSKFATRRVFRNRIWKGMDGEELEICQYPYTNNEMWIMAGTLWETLIKKSALIEFADSLAAREEYVISESSDYDSHPFFSAALKGEGYFFQTKKNRMDGVWLPFDKVDKVILFIRDNT